MKQFIQKKEASNYNFSKSYKKQQQIFKKRKGKKAIKVSTRWRLVYDNITDCLCSILGCQNGQIIPDSCLQRSKYGYRHTIKHFSGHSNELEACTGGNPVQI